jgi:hypothetical protein
MRRALGLLTIALFAAATPPSELRTPPPDHYSAPVPYDGRFTLVRLRWSADFPSSRAAAGSSAAWSHQYPRAERNLSAVARRLTYLDIHDDGNEILTLDDPNLFKYPVAFMWEPGHWNLTDQEAESFRAYLLKGGFAIFEDFDGPAEWTTFATQMRRVMPDGRFVRLGTSHQIFNAFFPIHDIDAIVHPTSRGRPSYYGMFERNDPSRRLMVVADYGNDVPEYWGRSGDGLLPLDVSNEAYKLGIDYMLYGITH